MSATGLYRFAKTALTINKKRLHNTSFYQAKMILYFYTLQNNLRPNSKK